MGGKASSCDYVPETMSERRVCLSLSAPCPLSRLGRPVRHRTYDSVFFGPGEAIFYHPASIGTVCHPIIFTIT